MTLKIHARPSLEILDLFFFKFSSFGDRIMSTSSMPNKYASRKTQFIILLLFSPFLDRIMSASSMLQCSFPFGRQMEGPMGGEGPPGCPFPLSTHTNYCTKFYCKVIVKTEIQGKGIEKKNHVTLL